MIQVPASKFDPARLRIIRISIAKAAIEASEAYLSAPVQPATNGMNFTTELGFDFTAKVARARVKVEMEGLDKDQNKLGLSGCYDIFADVLVENLEECSKQLDGKHEVDGHLAISIMGIVYSTVRGMILERTSGTFFGGVLLPVVDPKVLVPMGAPQ